MNRRLETLPGFNAVVAGGTATLELPANDTYMGLKIQYDRGGAPATQAQFGTDLTELRFRVNGKVQRRLSAAEILNLNTHKGKAFTAGILPIFFAEPHRRTVEGEDILGWGMADVQSFQLEIDIAAGATTPVLRAHAVKLPVRQPMGAIVKWRKFTTPVTAAGLVSVSTLPKSDAYYALHALTADITRVRILRDNVAEFEGPRALLHDLLADYGLVPITGWTHVAFDHTRRVHDALPMRHADGRPVQDYRAEFDMSVATTHTLITEVLGPRD
jgi:hypothetical protein